MKKLLIALAVVSLTSYLFAESVDIDITSTSGTYLINGNDYSSYDTVNAHLADGVVFTNTDQRIINALKDNTTYNITGGTGSSITVNQTGPWNALVLGEVSGTSGTINLYVDTNVNTDVATALVFQGGVTLNVYGNLNTNKGNLVSSTNATVYVKTGGTFSLANISMRENSYLIVDGGTVNFNHDPSNKAANNTLAAGSSITVNSGSFNHTTTGFLNVNGNITINGGKAGMSLAVNSGGSVTFNGGSYSTSRSQILNGGEYIYYDGSINTAIIAVTATSNFKIYSDLTYDSSDTYPCGVKSFNFRDYKDDGILNLYTNGFNFATKEFYSSSGMDVKVNIIIEEGYEWANNAIHITNMLEDDLKEAINDIIIAGQSVNKDTIKLVSDGNTGYYINLIPEPAEWAAIFGALALLFVARRRK